MITTGLIPVGLGELKVSTVATETIVCFGLGSCIGLAMYDPISHVAGMVHVVLPDSKLSREREVPVGRFADTAVPALLAQLAKHGANAHRITARMAGGARMLHVVGAGSRLDIGARNAEAVRAALKEHGIHLHGEDTGGTFGRTVHLFVGTGRLTISTVGRGEKEL